jgi:hypothetical protein
LPRLVWITITGWCIIGRHPPPARFAMKRVYECPHCRARLNPNVKIILQAAKRKRRGLILLSPQPGNYTVYPAEGLQLEKGDRITFRCPVCHADLKSPHSKDLVEIGFRNPNGDAGRLSFSRVFGEHATFFIVGEEVRVYGEDAGRYKGLNPFGETFG